MTSKFLKKQGQIGFFCVFGLIFGFHYFIINEFVVPFPNWGDDLGFIDQAKRFSDGEISIVETYYPFHNIVHVCWLIKFFFWIQIKTFGIIDYKLSVQIGQILLIPLIYLYRSYFKIQNWSVIFQISFLFILFSLKGNLDNLVALGLFQHAITVLCIVFAGYYSILKKSYFKSFLITNICLFLNSTEITGALFMLMIMVLFTNEAKKYFYIVFSLVNIIIYYLGIKHSENLLQLHSPSFYISFNFLLGILTFVGGLFSNIKVLVLLGIVYLFIVVIAFFNIPGKLKDKFTSNQFFPIYVFLSIFSIGILIQLGRTDPQHPEIGIFTSIATRFSFYHLSIFCSIFIIIVENLKLRVRFLPIFTLIFAILFYGFNLYKIWPNLKFDSKRVAIDYHNFFNSGENLFYGSDKNLVNRFINSKVLVAPDSKWINQLKRKGVFNVQKVEVDGTFTNFIGPSTLATPFLEIELVNQKRVFAPIQMIDSNLGKFRVSTDWLKSNKFKNIYLLQ